MLALPRVVNPLAAFYVRDGVDVVLVTVELWETDTVVRLAGRPADPAAEERHHEALLEEWAAQGRRGRPPTSRGERLLDVDLELADDVGTTYILRSAERGGSGRLYRGDWFFITPVPPAATTITVSAATKDGAELGSVAVEL